MPDASSTPSPIAATGGLGFADAQPGELYRDEDVLDALEAALKATGQFDAIYRCSISEVSGKPAGNLRAACIEPNTESETDPNDGDDGPTEVVSAQVAITVIARHADPRTRDRIAGRLRNVARNALAGKSHCGLTMPDFTRFSAWQWQKPTPPTRMVRGTFGYKYQVDSYASFADDE